MRKKAYLFTALSVFLVGGFVLLIRPVFAQSVPLNPAKVTAVYQNGGMQVSWSLVPSVKGYRIYKSGTGSGGFLLYTAGSGTLSFRDSYVGCQTTIYYGVSAYNAYGESAKIWASNPQRKCNCFDLDLNRNGMIDPFVVGSYNAEANPAKSGADMDIFNKEYDKFRFNPYYFSDLNKDGSVNIQDFSIYASYYSKFGPTGKCR